MPTKILGVAFLLSLFVAFSSYIPAVNAVCNPVTGQECYSYYYTYLTVYSNPTNGGTISGEPSGATFRELCRSPGAAVGFGIYETPNSGFVFENWSNGQTATSISVVVPCGSSGSITANFLPFPIITDAYAYSSANGSPQPINKSYDIFSGSDPFSLSGFTNSTYLNQNEGSNFTVSTGEVNGTDFVFISYFQEGGNYYGCCTGDGKYCMGSFTGDVAATVVLFKNASSPQNYYNGSISASYMPLSGSTQLNDLGRFAMLYSPTFYNWLGGFSSSLKSIGSSYVVAGDSQNPNNMTEITLGEYYWDVGAAMWSFQQDMGGPYASHQNQIISSYVIVRSTAVFDSLQWKMSCATAILENCGPDFGHRCGYFRRW